MIYLDYAATNPVRPEVVEVIQDALIDDFANASSIYQSGKKSKMKLIHARKQLAEMLNTDPKTLYFTSGATEANNWAIRSQAFQARKLGLGNHIVATNIEHPSVAEVLDYLSQIGFEVTYLNPLNDHAFSVDQFQAASKPTTIGWVAMAANNEVGSILPIQALGKAAHALGYWFHVDAVQLMGHANFNEILGAATSFSASAHKFGGPKGIGFLAYNAWQPELSLQPLIYGGGQERKKRSGTENLPYILGMVKALELTMAEMESNHQQALKFRQYILEHLQAADINYEVNGDRNHYSSHILNVWFPGFPADQLLIKLDLQGVCVSAGSACSAGTLSDSPILQAYYPDQPDRWHQSLRISFGFNTTNEDVQLFTQKLIKILEGK